LRLGDIDAPVVPLEMAGSALTPPDDPRVVGWWGKRMGARHGTTLLTGHTVHDGGGTFDDLEETPVGARAHLNRHSYAVRSVQVISKDELARRASALFAQTGRPKLVLVTCEDYDRTTGHYASNVVVTLDPVAAPAPA
jgi:LPXTG-site transpeptidase (sortase) family protein